MPTIHDSPVSVIVLTGGRATRMGMADKASMQVGGVPILQRIVGCLPGHEVWVVGAEVSGGPVAGIAVGVTQTDRDLVAVFAGDQPFVAEALPSLRAAVVGHDVAVLTANRRRQFLASLWRRDALTAALTRIGSPVDAPARSLFVDVDVVEVDDTGRWSTDVDTPEDLAAANSEANQHPVTGRADHGQAGREGDSLQ
ncbi:MAG: molybdenum cofactor guanylyltransferase [Nocardioides sp.]